MMAVKQILGNTRAWHPPVPVLEGEAIYMVERRAPHGDTVLPMASQQRYEPTFMLTSARLTIRKKQHILSRWGHHEASGPTRSGKSVNDTAEWTSPKHCCSSSGKDVGWVRVAVLKIQVYISAVGTNFLEPLKKLNLEAELVGQWPERECLMKKCGWIKLQKVRHTRMGEIM